MAIGLLTRHGRLAPIRILIDADELRALVWSNAMRKRPPERPIADASLAAEITDVEEDVPFQGSVQFP